MVRPQDYRQGEGPSDNDVRKEFISSYDRERQADGQLSSDHDAKRLRRLKRVDDIRKKKDMESTYHGGYDRHIKDRERTGHVGQFLKTDLPMDRLPQMLAYEQLGELHDQGPWRCPACGTKHMDPIPEIYKHGRIMAGCGFCGNINHWFNRLNMRRI